MSRRSCTPKALASSAESSSADCSVSFAGGCKYLSQILPRIHGTGVQK